MSIQADPWRLRCPKGHVHLQRRTTGPNSHLEENHWYCDACCQYHDECKYRVAVDAKTGREVQA